MKQNLALKKVFTLGAAALGAISVIAAASNAAAVETIRNADGTAPCIPAEQINAQLEREGQVTIIAGDRFSSEAGRGFTIRITSRPDGTLGNVFEGNGSVVNGQASTCFTVTDKLTNIRIRPPELNQPWGYIQVDDAIARAALARDTFGRAAIHNESITAGYRNGVRLLLVADRYSTDGTRLASLFTFSIMPSHSQNLGTASYTNASGVVNTAFDTVGTRLTTGFYDQYNRPVTVANIERGTPSNGQRNPSNLAPSAQR